MLHLRSRILLVLSGTALVFIAAMYAIERVTLLPSFLELEQEHAIANLERGVAALQNEVAFVGDFVGDWSGWDDTYAFVHDQNEDYTKSNLDSNAFRPDSFDFLSFINLKGKEIWRGCEVAGERLAVPEIPTGNWPLDHVLLQPREPDDCATGILATSWGSMLLASRPISDSAREAKPNGWLVMGRFLSPARQKKLAEQTNLDLMGRPIANATSGDLLATAARLANGDNYDLHAVDDWHLTTSARVRGLTGDHDDLMLVVSQDRRILKQARTTLAYALVAMVLMVLPLFAVLMWLLHRTVVAPVTQLKDHALLIRASDDLTRRCAMDREDEIGTLAKEFDGMVERLAASQAQMMVHAREGGMAEVASEVLHDVGNALQAVTTSAGLLRQKLSSQATDDLGRIGGMLAEHAHDLQQWLSCDPKGQQVPRYLSMLADNLVAERDVIKEEVRQLAHGIHHIENLVRQQNEHTHRKGVVEAVDVTVLIAEAVRLSSIEEQGVVVVTQVAAAVIRTQKHRLLAVLINLLKNAAHSVLQVAEERQAIRIEATVANDLLSIRVADDGVGIAAENLDRIFETGFSSKPNSCGRGLHSSANSVRELGGKLRVESDGEDRGACFLVELPMHQAGVTAGG